MTTIEPITMPGIHSRFLKYFEDFFLSSDLKVLDIGAGYGAFTKKLYEMGFNVTACDLFPEIFKFNKVDSQKVDITLEFPYQNNAFDIVIGIEISEHTIDHEMFFSEVSRILKPNGHFFITTPDILSLKSRVKFLKVGFCYSFKPLEIENYDGLQHVASITIDQYNYIAVKHGFKKAKIDIDKRQKSSIWLLILLYPFLWFSMIKKDTDIHDDLKLLLGRILFLHFENDSIETKNI